MDLLHGVHWSGSISKGDTLGGRPWTVTLAGDYRFNVMSREAYLRGDFAYAAHNNDISQPMDPKNTSYDVGASLPEATYLTNFRVGIQLGDWDVSAFVDNAFDSHPVLNRTSPLWYDTTFQPRTFGITATFRK